ncbi:carboxylesterase [mine drainage metagenome]|uniref:Carboxylesterase n=1 Tax=mine drainage metagenome TaxID=410659 RepID=A0A1J5TNG9_9ZZZZ
MQLPRNPNNLLYTISLSIVMLLACPLSYAGAVSDRIMEYRLQQTQDIEDAEYVGNITLPSGAKVIHDVPYGKDSQQRMDVYLPAQAAGAPVIFMVHGGAWRLGDKGAQAVAANKVTRWVSKGFILVSANYRLLPNTAPIEQAQDIANALATAQDKAASWGGDPTKFILMGHSAGAHLVALLAASPEIALKVGAKRWLGAVLLDSAALDLVKIMEAKHLRLYDRAFGDDPAYWKAASPFHNITQSATPILAVCSTLRIDSCSQADRFVNKAMLFNVRASVLEQNLTHKEINQQLGVDGAYTDAVEAFMATLNESVMHVLANHPSTTHRTVL